MKYLILLLSPMVVLAQSNLSCPPESYVIEYISPVSKGKVAFCGYQKNGETVKHGKEEIYDQKGMLVKSKFYTHGMEGKNLPGTEEFVDNLMGKKQAPAKESVQKMMKVLSIQKGIDRGEFQVEHCDRKPKDWAVAGLTKSKLSRAYMFGEKCDVAGTFTANFSEPFPVTFQLRHLDDFDNVKMSVKMDLNRSMMRLVYKYDVKDGVISGKNRTVKFLANYEVEIDMISGNAFPETQKGTLTIIEDQGKTVNETTDLKFDN